MAVPAVALPAIAPGYVSLSSRHAGSHYSPDYEQNARFSACSSSTTSSPASCGRKPVLGGLSCLFSSSPLARLSPTADPSSLNDELSSSWLDRSDELASSFSYSSSSSSSPIRCVEQSPVSVLRSLVSCSSRSPPSLRVPREMSRVVDLRLGREKLLNRFVGYASDSCLDYSSTLPVPGSNEKRNARIPFDLEESLEKLGASAEPYANDLLVGAQSRHNIFNDKFVVKAFYVADKAHKGQVLYSRYVLLFYAPVVLSAILLSIDPCLLKLVYLVYKMRMSGDPYLQHCVETAVLLAKIGANATVVAAGLLHDTFDDSFMTYDYILREFGAGLADLVQGVCSFSLVNFVC